MFLKSPDPDAHAVIHHGIRYPVRGGAFLVPPDLRGELTAFAEADQVDPEVARELAELGHWHDDEEQPAAAPAAADPSGDDSSDDNAADDLDDPDDEEAAKAAFAARVDELAGLPRKQLDEQAAALNIDEPAKLPNKQAVAEAIAAAEASA